MTEANTTDDQRPALVELYDSALPDVYGYLVSRCGSAAVAEDLTSEMFLAAVDAVRRRCQFDFVAAARSVSWLLPVFGGVRR